MAEGDCLLVDVHRPDAIAGQPKARSSHGPGCLSWVVRLVGNNDPARGYRSSTSRIVVGCSGPSFQPEPLSAPLVAVMLEVDTDEAQRGLDSLFDNSRVEVRPGDEPVYRSVDDRPPVVTLREAPGVPILARRREPLVECSA